MNNYFVSAALPKAGEHQQLFIVFDVMQATQATPSE